MLGPIGAIWACVGFVGHKMGYDVVGPWAMDSSVWGLNRRRSTCDGQKRGCVSRHEGKSNVWLRLGRGNNK